MYVQFNSQLFPFGVTWVTIIFGGGIIAAEIIQKPLPFSSLPKTSFKTLVEKEYYRILYLITF
jgi:hypothetical protein